MSAYIDKQSFISQMRDIYCNDCIRRKNEKLQYVYEIGGAACSACDIGDMIDYVDDFPTVDVVPVIHAHWEERLEDYPTGLLRCTNCGVAGGYTNSNYCRYCGAKMDEREGAIKWSNL